MARPQVAHLPFVVNSSHATKPMLDPPCSSKSARTRAILAPKSCHLPSQSIQRNLIGGLQTSDPTTDASPPYICCQYAPEIRKSGSGSTRPGQWTPSTGSEIVPWTPRSRRRASRGREDLASATPPRSASSGQRRSRVVIRVMLGRSRRPSSSTESADRLPRGRPLDRNRGRIEAFSSPARGRSAALTPEPLDLLVVVQEAGQDESTPSRGSR